MSGCVAVARAGGDRALDVSQQPGWEDFGMWGVGSNRTGAGHRTRGRVQALNAVAESPSPDGLDGDADKWCYLLVRGGSLKNRVGVDVLATGHRMTPDSNEPPADTAYGPGPSPSS